MTSEERSVYIQTLRDKFVNGSLDDVLIPGDPPMDRLLDAIFDKRLPKDKSKNVSEHTKSHQKPS
jgi:hypothetical protein